MKDFISLHDYSKEQIEGLLKLAIRLKTELKNGIPHPLLKGKTLGMIFTKSSTRTRVSFEVGMTQLGGYPLFLSSADIQLGRGESIYGERPVALPRRHYDSHICAQRRARPGKVCVDPDH